jgi:hypothetical protein
MDRRLTTPAARCAWPLAARISSLFAMNYPLPYDRGAISALRYLANSRFKASDTMASTLRSCSEASVFSCLRTTFGRCTVIGAVPSRDGCGLGRATNCGGGAAGS